MPFKEKPPIAGKRRRPRDYLGYTNKYSGNRQNASREYLVILPSLDSMGRNAKQQFLCARCADPEAVPI